MKVDGYKVTNILIEDVIDKLTEADGSATNRVNYLIRAVALLAEAIAEITAEETEERLS